MAHITIYTDGSCKGNPGLGGYAAILLVTSQGQQVEKRIGGYSANTTNNQMELMAVLESLKTIKGHSHTVTIYTDSQNVIGWLSMGWKIKVPAIAILKNEIWQVITNKGLIVNYGKVPGHSEHRWNEEVDQMASNYASQLTLEGL